MGKIVWTNNAYKDLKEISDYISNDSKRYALHQINGIKESTKALKKNPLIGRSVPEVGVEYLRELIKDNYRIIYKIVDKNTVHIITVHHSSKSLKEKQLL